MLGLVIVKCPAKARMNYTTIHLPQISVLCLIEVAYGFTAAQSATSLWTVKGAFTFVVTGGLGLT